MPDGRKLSVSDGAARPRTSAEPLESSAPQLELDTTTVRDCARVLL
jgi:hypothetical protein